jgi:hypothetical protein
MTCHHQKGEMVNITAVVLRLARKRDTQYTRTRLGLRVWCAARCVSAELNHSRATKTRGGT